MPIARPESSDSRIIAHVDMDCFYVQVEQRKQPHLRGLPTAVVQYNSFKGGALIAVSYEARKYGVKRSMRGDEAKQVCPQIQLIQVPVTRSKADLNIYRNAGSEVVTVLARKGRCERASIDEAYLDLTDAAEAMLMENPPESWESVDDEVLKSHVLGLHNEEGRDPKTDVRDWLCRSNADHRDKLLACGALIVAELRMQVLKETEFTCSAGIAHNKMLAKLASAFNKPAQQTVVPYSSVKQVLEPLPIKKMKQLGGKLGSSLQCDLGVDTVGGLLQFSMEKLQQHYGVNTGTWLWKIARGICGDEVQGRLLPKSHGSGKTFPGPRVLKTMAAVQHWLNELCEELSERLSSDLEQNKRIARTLTLHARAYKSIDSESHKNFPSKSCPLRYGSSKIQEDAILLFQAALREYIGPSTGQTDGSQHIGWGITGLSVSASNIVTIPSGTSSITKYFNGRYSSNSSLKHKQEENTHEAVPLSPSGSQNCSGLNTNEPEFGYDEEIRIKHAATGLNQQIPSLTDSEQVDDSTQGSSLATESCARMTISEPQRLTRVTEAGISCSIPCLGGQEQKKSSTKEKGNSSILQLFKNYSGSSGSSSKQENVKNAEGTIPGSNHPSKHSEGSSQKAATKTNNKGWSSAHSEQRGESWGYRIDEIDPAIIDELPAEIQEEIQVWLRPHKRPNTDKRGSSITHYFTPNKS